MNRDRTGEVVEPDSRAAIGDHLCRRGWLTRTDADQPKPCLTCKPWLAHARQPTAAELAAFERRHPKPERRAGGAR